MTAALASAPDQPIRAARPLVVAGLVSLALHGSVFAAASWLWSPAAPPKVPALVAVTVVADSLVRPKIKSQPGAPTAKPGSLKEIVHADLRAMKPAPNPAVPKSAEPAVRENPSPDPIWGDAPPIPPHTPRFRVRNPARHAHLKPATPDPRADKPPLVKVAPVIAAPGGAEGGRQTAKASLNRDSGVIAPPRPVAGIGNPAPQYPWISRRRGEQGRVVLDVTVTADGRAKAVRVKRSSGSARLDQAALAAVKRWRFSPAMRGGRAVAGRIDVPIAFRLTK